MNRGTPRGTEENRAETRRETRQETLRNLLWKRRGNPGRNPQGYLGKHSGSHQETLRNPQETLRSPKQEPTKETHGEPQGSPREARELP